MSSVRSLCHVFALCLSFSLARASRRCDFAVLDGANLTWADFEAAGLRGRPVLVTGLAAHIPLDVWNRSGFIERFGSERVQASNGRNIEGQRHHVEVLLREFLELRKVNSTAPRSPRTIFLSDLLTHVQREIWREVSGDAAPLVKKFAARPVLSVGILDSSEDFHAHDETWLMLLAGRKAWWIAERSRLARLEGREGCGMRREGPASREGALYCEQAAGEAVFFGEHAHATCNLEDFVLGVGAQGRSEGWPEAVQVAHLGSEGALMDWLAGADRDKAISSLAATTQQGRTALHQASVWGHVAAAKLLVALRADPESKGKDGNQPVHTAALHGHANMVQYLSPPEVLVGVLHFAAMHGHTAVAEAALSRGGKKKVVDAPFGPKGSLPLHFAAKGGHQGLVELLLQKSAQIDDTTKDERASPLHLAAAMGHVAVVALLAKRRANLALKDARGLLPIHLAIRAGACDVLASLIGTQGASIPQDLALFAAEGGQVEALDLLASRDARVLDALDGRGFRPVHLAALGGHVSALEFLASRAPGGVAAADRKGFTALHFAVKGGHSAAVSSLLALRADLNARAADGTSVAEVAKVFGHSAVLEVLGSAPTKAKAKRKASSRRKASTGQTKADL